MEQIDGLLVVVPVFTPRDQSAAPYLTGLLEEMCDICERMIVVAQGAKINLPPEIEVLHLEEPAGIWGAIHAADTLIRGAIDAGISLVAVNSAPLYYGCEDVYRMAWLAEDSLAYHVVGRRVDVAASLGSRPRALLEFFLTLLGEQALFRRSGISRDGFCGLQIFSRHRWLEWDWSWIKHTTWGGTFEGQCQTIAAGAVVDFCPVPHRVPRTWKTTLGSEDKEVVVSMLDQALRLPAFRSVCWADIVRAICDVNMVFASQPCVRSGFAEEDLCRLITYYCGRGEKKIPFYIG